MVWEQRERESELYYYRGRRVEGCVRKVYRGHGRLEQLASELDSIEHQKRVEEAAFWRQEREHLKREAAFLLELEEATKILTKAYLSIAGCHKHKGEWRRLRESA